jgi:hypothetical protein
VRSAYLFVDARCLQCNLTAAQGDGAVLLSSARRSRGLRADAASLRCVRRLC